MASKKEKKVKINKEQLKLVLGLLSIVILVGFLFFINDNSTDLSTGKAIANTNTNYESTISCSAENLAEVNTFAEEKGCEII